MLACMEFQVIDDNDADAKERLFSQLVHTSWQRFNEQYLNQKYDEVVVGAVISAHVKAGFLLIDLSSDGTYHHLRFENPTDQTRAIVQLRNLAEDLTVARVLGRLASVTIGYGEKAPNLGTVWNAFKTELKSIMMATPEPGVITFDADLTGGYIYAQVPLVLNLDDYIDANLKVNLPLLQQHIDVTTHTLRKYLRGRLALA